MAQATDVSQSQSPVSPLTRRERRILLAAVTPGFVITGLGWYFGRPPAAMLACMAMLGVGSGCFIEWASRRKVYAFSMLLLIPWMFFKPPLHHYFLGVEEAKVPGNVLFAELGAWATGLMVGAPSTAKARSPTADSSACDD